MFGWFSLRLRNIESLACEVRDLLRQLVFDFENLRRVEARKLDAILRRLGALEAQEGAEMAALDDLKIQVQANSVVIDSAVVLIQGIADRIRDAGGDPVALKALEDELRAKDAELAAAVTANTPLPPTP